MKRRYINAKETLREGIAMSLSSNT